MSYNFLDKTGLTYFYDKIKTIFAKKSEIPTKTSQLTNDSAFNSSSDVTAGTIDTLAAFTSGKPGRTGSISLTKKSSGVGSEIPAGWYNYYFSPHRTGSGGDNIQYGTIILTPMNFAGASWILRRSSSTTSITEVKKIAVSTDIPTKTSQLTNDSGFITTHQDISGKVDKLGVLNVLRYPETTGYLKFAECDLSSGGYGNKYIVLFVTTEYGTSTKVNNGMIFINIRGNGTNASSVSEFYWLMKNYQNNNDNNALCWAASDHKVEFYRKAYATNEYSQVSFKVLHIGNFEMASKWNFNLINVPFIAGTPLDTPIGTVTNITDNGFINRSNIAESASKLKNFYSARPTNINTTPSGDGGLIKFVATSSTTTGKPPSGDANVVQMNWDSTAGWDSQFAICTGEVAEFEFRNQRNSVWSSWKRLLRKDDMASSTNNGVMSSTDKAKLDGIASGATANTGTVTSVAVKMNNTTKGTVTTSGTIDLGTVITSHQDISGKQDKLATQTAYTSKGSATKVPQITTNTLGQVTGISEVTISQPTVNNGTLTIQKNGTNVQTFSANQSGNATANITVPTKVSDLNNDSNFTSKTYVDNAVAANRGAENPIATILAYAGSEAPDGYLLCRGQAVSRTTYSLLFNAIGTQYGTGDGSTTFNIPDLQGKVIAGLDIVDEDFNVLGKTGGSKTVQLTKNQLPKINGSFTMHGAGSSTPVSNVSGDFTSDYNNTKYKNGGTEASGAGSKGNVKLVIGNDEAHENKQPYNTLNYIIKAYSGTDVPVPVESNSVKNSYDDSIANVYSTNYINTKVRGKKLWTNPNPSSNFAAQTITFDETNDYDFYKIKIKYGTDESYAYDWQDVEVGDIFNLLLMWSYTPGIADPSIKGHIATGFRPDCSCNHNSITFTNAVYYTSMDSTKSVNDTSHCIPLEIYGYYI